MNFHSIANVQSILKYFKLNSQPTPPQTEMLWKSEITIKLKNFVQDFHSTIFTATQSFFGFCFDVEHFEEKVAFHIH